MKTLEERALEWDDAHPEFWNLVLRFTFDLINRGRKRGGIAQVFERIRWEAMMAERADYKANNDFRAWYARRFASEYPEHADFFATRESKLDYGL